MIRPLLSSNPPPANVVAARFGWDSPGFDDFISAATPSFPPESSDATASIHDDPFDSSKGISTPSGHSRPVRHKEVKPEGTAVDSPSILEPGWPLPVTPPVQRPAPGMNLHFSSSPVSSTSDKNGALAVDDNGMFSADAHPSAQDKSDHSCVGGKTNPDANIQVPSTGERERGVMPAPNAGPVASCGDFPPITAASAKIAETLSFAVSSAFLPENFMMQTVLVACLNTRTDSLGTSGANAEIVVNAISLASPNSATIDGFDGGAADASEVDARSGHRDRSHQDEAGAMMIARSAGNMVLSAGEPVPALLGSTPGGPTVTMEALLQRAWCVGEGLRPAGYGELELRVRLGDEAEDVTVRLHVSSDRVLVTFQTRSPSLRRSLEQGWKQLSTGENQSSNLPPSSTFRERHGSD